MANSGVQQGRFGGDAKSPRVFVDDMGAPYGRMRMFHMIADTDEALHAMADAIGVARKWGQSPEKTSGSHYDVCQAKRALAVKLGAIEITWRQCGAMNSRRRVTGLLGEPGDAEAWLRERRSVQRLESNL